VWRLVRRDGRLTLLAVIRSDEWPAREAARARCHAHPGTPAPSGSCSCGLYAATSPEALAASQVFTDTTTVVGAVAMWGAVVEHARGARAAISYPARLRLVCAPCLLAGRGAIEPSSVVGTAHLVAVCLRHAFGVRGPRASASVVQAELLSTYAVDLLPIECVSGSLKFRRAMGSANPHSILVQAGTVLVQAVGVVINAVMALIVVASVLSMVLAVIEWLVGRFP
jgi:hypothetical protein